MNSDALPPDGNHLLAAHYLPVMRLCLSRLRDPADAEDAAQEVFRRAVQHASTLRDDPLPWLIAVAKNVCNDELRRRKRRPTTVADGAALMAPGDTTPEVTVVGRMAVMELLGRLTPGERRAVATRMANGGGGLPTSTTRVLLSRARVKLRQYIEESQSAFGTATVYGSEALHRLRSRLFGRTVVDSGRAAVVIPAALMIGIVGGAGGGPPSLDGTSRSAVTSFAPPGSTGYPQSLPLRGELPPRGAAVLSRIAPVAGVAEPGIAVLPPPVGPVWGTALQEFDYRQVTTSDVQPSPTYGSDHTVLMMGPNYNCPLDVCAQIYRSSDGGATWTFVTSQGPHGTKLLLPASTYPAGRFYVYGTAGLQVTNDRGANFSTVLPATLGYAVTAPPSSGLDLVIGSGNQLWGIRHSDGGAILLSLFQDGSQAAGPPTVIPTATGYAVLQGVSPTVSNGAPPSLLERCTPACGPLQPMPIDANYPVMLASPEVASDHTVFATAWGRPVAVSHDDGLTWTVTGNPVANDMIVAHGPAGLRLIATLGDHGALLYSDDSGRTWHRSEVRVRNLAYGRAVAELRPGRLIASMMRTDDLGWFYFVCSPDGTVWTLCTPDRG